MIPTIGALPAADIAAQLAGQGLLLRTGPIVQRITSRLPEVARTIRTLYAHHPVPEDDGFADFHVGVRRAPGLRGHWRAQAEFLFDGAQPFAPLPLPQAYALLEWGLNWCVAQTCHQYLIIHAAAVERNGRVAILPAPPGSGKSTLCAALVQRGWRLCSDELTLIDPADNAIQALARPINLKNQSIGLISDFAPDARFGPLTHDTTKGTVGHLRPPQDSVARVNERARPRWIIFPRWQAGSTPQLVARPKAEAFIELADNAFNYSVLGEQGFTTLAGVIDDCESMSFTYDRLDDAITVFDRLAEKAR